MPRYVLLDYVKMDHAEKIRKAEHNRLVSEVLRTRRRPSLVKALLLALSSS